jgi:hypothetical protein
MCPARQQCKEYYLCVCTAEILVLQELAEIGVTKQIEFRFASEFSSLKWLLVMNTKSVFSLRFSCYGTATSYEPKQVRAN